MGHEWTRGSYLISTDIEKIDLDVVHGFLTSSYWSEGIPRTVVEEALRNSLPFGLYRDDEQVGFARVVTDRATFAWVCDVFVLPSERGAGLGKWLMQVVVDHPDLQGLRRWMLATRDAHELYRKIGFSGLPSPERYMEIARTNIYLREQG